MEAIVRPAVETQCMELRVHGVSGTPVASMLDDPNPVMVVGDRMAGFYRRGPRPNAPHTAADEGTNLERTLEAYSWGRLTAGSATRALWLLLLPFMLVNVAEWMHPDLSQSNAANRAQRWCVALVLRVLALTLTLTLVLAVVGVAMDVAAWQRGLATCTTTGATGQPIKFLASWLKDCGAATMLLGALVPVALIGVLWFLAWGSSRYEERKVLRPVTPVDGVPLSELAYWDGAIAHRRMRRCHLASALAIVGMTASRATGENELHEAIPVAGLLTIGLSAIWLAVPWFSDHVASRTPTETGNPNKFDEDAVSVQVRDGVVVATLILSAAVVVFGLVGLAMVGPPLERALMLPSFESQVQLLFALQVVMLLILLLGGVGVALWAARLAPPDSRVPWPALRGTGAALVATLGVMLAAAMGPALAVAGPRVVDLRHGPEALLRFRLPDDVQLPAQYYAAAALSVAFLPVVVLIGLRLWRQFRAAEPATRARVESAYWTAERTLNPDETEAVVSTEAAATLTDRASGHVAVLTGWGFILAMVSVLAVWFGAGFRRFVDWYEASFRRLGDWLGRQVRPLGDWFGAQFPRLDDWLGEHFPPLGDWFGHLRVIGIDVGMWTVTVGFLLLVVVGALAYRSQNLRRTVGILWDLGTFWPRATHPLAPPSYSERTVPDIAHRLDRLTTSSGVVLAAHSQGSIIATAVLVRLTPPTLERVALLTFGSPLERLYGRYFPAYFGPKTLDHLKACCDGRWTNLHRPTDPIGGKVRLPGVDRSIARDPESLETPAETPAMVRPRGHSGYPDHSSYSEAMELLLPTLGCGGVIVEPSTAEVVAAPGAAHGWLSKLRARRRQ